MRDRLRSVQGWMKKRWQVLTILGSIPFILCIYPAFVLGYTWIKVAQSDLPGGRHGPLDAYRHTLASAVVAYTLNEEAVEWVNGRMEDERYLTQRMDIHNNRVGARIGSQANSFWEIEAAVAKQIASGQVMTRDAHQSTWLPEACWQHEKKMW